MTPHSRSPDRRGVGYPPRPGNGQAGSVSMGLDSPPGVGMAGGSNGIGGGPLTAGALAHPAATPAAAASTAMR